MSPFLHVASKAALFTLIYAPLSLIAHEESFASSFNQSAFVPDISLIVDTSYVNRSISDERQKELSLFGSAYPEFVEFHSHNGFNLNYGELTLHSDVDPNFELDGVFHFNTKGVEIEEAYFTTTSLPFYLRLKGGKFKSDFGRLNVQHQHIWDFADAPLVYTTFLTPEGLNNIGLQLQYLAPTPWYMMIGVELLQEGNGAAFSNGGFDGENNNTIKSANAPDLAIAYLKNSFDIDDTTFILGFSAAHGSTKNEEAQLNGSSSIYGVDLTLKSYFNSYSYLTWQSEALIKQSDLIDTTLATNQSVTTIQSGLYTQLVYAYNQNWRTGLRYDGMYDDTKNSANTQEPLEKYTIMG